MAEEEKRYWVVMKLMSWNTLEVRPNYPFLVGWAKVESSTEDGCIGFMPVFKTKEEAMKFDHGSDVNVYEVRATPVVTVEAETVKKLIGKGESDEQNKSSGSVAGDRKKKRRAG